MTGGAEQMSGRHGTRSFAECISLESVRSDLQQITLGDYFNQTSMPTIQQVGADGQRGVCGIRFASVQSRREGAPPFLPGAPRPSPQGVGPLVDLPAKRLPGRWASAWRRRGSTYSNNQIAYSRPLTWIHRHRLGTS